MIARSNPERALLPQGTSRIDLDHRSQDIAHCAAHAQLAWYELMARQGQMRFIRTVDDLEAHWREVTAEPAKTSDAPVGMVLVMEGADPVTQPDELPYWFDRGLRQINLVHYGVNRYAHGTGAEGGLTDDGRSLLKQCERTGVALDVTHLADAAFFEALDVFHGPVLASHQNCRALVPGGRQFTDEQLRLVIERGGVIGAAMDNWMLIDGWKTGVTPREQVTLRNVADHIDHVCQLAGHHRCAAVGTDLDGGFGCEQAPNDVNSIADVQQLEAILTGRGYGEDALDAIFHGNWLRFLRRTLPHGGAGATNATPRGTLETSNA
jgi:membrane dipeptidase